MNDFSWVTVNNSWKQLVRKKDNNKKKKERKRKKGKRHTKIHRLILMQLCILKTVLFFLFFSIHYVFLLLLLFQNGMWNVNKSDNRTCARAQQTADCSSSPAFLSTSLLPISAAKIEQRIELLSVLSCSLAGPQCSPQPPEQHSTGTYYMQESRKRMALWQHPPLLGTKGAIFCGHFAMSSWRELEVGRREGEKKLSRVLLLAEHVSAFWQ